MRTTYSGGVTMHGISNMGAKVMIKMVPNLHVVKVYCNIVHTIIKQSVQSDFHKVWTYKKKRKKKKKKKKEKKQNIPT